MLCFLNYIFIFYIKQNEKRQTKYTLETIPHALHAWMTWYDICTTPDHDFNIAVLASYFMLASLILSNVSCCRGFDSFRGYVARFSKANSLT